MDSIGDGDGGDSATPREDHSIGDGGDSAKPREEHSIGDSDGGDSATQREEYSIGNGGDLATPKEEHSISNGHGGDSATPREEHSISNGDGGDSAAPREAPPLLISQQSISTGSYSPRPVKTRPVDVSALKRFTGSTFENSFCKVCKRIHFQNNTSIHCLNAGDCCSKKCTCQDSLPKAESEAIILSFRQQEEKRLKRASENEDSKGCTCLLSKCVKLYCVCFNSGEYCAEGCDCRDCYNKTDNEDMIRDIRQQIWSRYACSPFPFERMMEQPATEYSPNSGVRSFDQVYKATGFAPRLPVEQRSKAYFRHDKQIPLRDHETSVVRKYLKLLKSIISNAAQIPC